MKRVLKRIVAFIAVAGCLMASSVSVFASFNPTYTGRFAATQNSYMTVSSEDDVMTKIIYPVSATYNENEILTTLDGEKIGIVSKPVIVQTNQIDVTTNWLGRVTDVCIIYNGLYYFRE